MFVYLPAARPRSGRLIHQSGCAPRFMRPRSVEPARWAAPGQQRVAVEASWALPSDMGERRWTWVVTSVLLMAAGLATGWSTYLHWLPCRGALLSGSLVRGYRYGPDFSDACLRRMDSGLPFPYPPEPSEQTPWASELGVVAMALAGTAWIVLLLGMRWSVRTKSVVALPGLATLMLAVISAVAIADTARGADDYVSVWLWVTPEAATVVAIAAILAWQPEVTGRCWARVLVVAWGTTAFGFLHMLVEYVLMIAFSDANWDAPPLTGYVTAATLIVAAVLTLTLALHSSPLPGSAEKDVSLAAHPQP